MKYLFLLFYSHLIFAETSVPIEKPESIEVLFCPKIGDIFISNGKKTLSSMEDLLQAMLEKNKNQNEFYIKLMELKKDNTEHSTAASQIKEIVNGSDSKISRSKDNYNNELKQLAYNLPKAKKCWSYHTPVQKNDISKLFELFQKYKILTQYKSCLTVLGESSKSINKQYQLSLKFYNKEISQYQFISEARKEEIKIKRSQNLEKTVCSDFTNQNGKFYYALNGLMFNQSTNLPKSELQKPNSETLIPKLDFNTGF